MIFQDWAKAKVMEKTTLADRLAMVGHTAAVKFACKFDDSTEGESTVFDEKMKVWMETGSVTS